MLRNGRSRVDKNRCPIKRCLMYTLAGKLLTISEYRLRMRETENCKTYVDFYSEYQRNSRFLKLPGSFFSLNLIMASLFVNNELESNSVTV